MINQLVTWQPGAWTKCYRASTDTFNAAVYHTGCNNRGPLYTVIKTTNGNIFGGYQSSSAGCACGYYTDNGMFIYSLKNPTNYPMTRFLYTITWDYVGYGPGYGYNDIGSIWPEWSNPTNQEGILEENGMYIDITATGFNSNTAYQFWDNNALLRSGRHAYTASEIEVYYHT